MFDNRSGLDEPGYQCHVTILARKHSLALDSDDIATYSTFPLSERVPLEDLSLTGVTDDAESYTLRST